LDAVAKTFAHRKPEDVYFLQPVITNFLLWGGELRLEAETENPFCELRLKCPLFQLERNSVLDPFVFWAICILAGSFVCSYA
jgi:hypothetical protein